MLLMGAQQEHAAEVIIGAGTEYGGDTLMRYEVGDTLREAAFPSDIRSRIVSELGKMAALPEGSFPKGGQFSVRLGSTHLKWRVWIARPEAECILTHTEG